MSIVIHIDAREGVSADMLLAAMIGLISEERRSVATDKLVSASERSGLSMHIIEVDDSGDLGTAISYRQKETGDVTTGHAEAYDRIDDLSSALGSGKERSRAILDRIFAAESAAHEMPLEQVHLHEIGRPQAMMNIAGIGFAADILDGELPGGWVASTVTTGRGIVVTGHGTMRLPAPATAYLLRELRQAPGDCPGERATPTGVAAIAALIKEQTDDIPENPLRTSCGFGTKRFAGRLGRTVLRAI